MNFFRSEEHIQNWAQFNPDSAEASLPLNDEVNLFSTEAGKHRLDGDYISQWLPSRRPSVPRQRGGWARQAPSGHPGQAPNP